MDTTETTEGTAGTAGTAGATTPPTGDRKIVGGVIVGGRTYKPGDEAKLHRAMHGRSFDRLLAKGVVTGDWSGAPPVVSEADADAMAAHEAAAKKRADRVAERTARRTQQAAKRAKTKGAKKAAKSRRAGAAKKGR